MSSRPDRAAMIGVNALRGCVGAAANAGLQPLEVAALVGIEGSVLADPDASAFSHALRRWTGQTASDWRRRRILPR